MTLLAFAIQTATSAAKALKNAIKDVPNEETLKPKTLNYRLYIDLIQRITKLITHVTDREPIVKADNEVNEINNLIKFMNSNNVP